MTFYKIRSKYCTPAVCLRLMTDVGEVRNKALQDNEQLKRFSMGDTLFRRDARQNITLFMSCIKRTQRGKIPKEKAFSPFNIYVATQRNYFKRLKPTQDVTCTDSERAVKTSRKQQGIYNGLPWVLLFVNSFCNSTTPPPFPNCIVSFISFCQ